MECVKLPRSFAERPTSYRSRAAAGENVRATSHGLPTRRALAAAVTLWAIASGCGDDVVHTQIAPDHAKLRAIVMVYRQATRKLGRPPRENRELLDVLTKAGAPADTLTSTRDGLPFAVVWDVQLDRGEGDAERHAADAEVQPGDDFPLVYEQAGVAGSRLVANRRGEVREVDAGRFGKYRFPRGHQPPAATQ